MTSPRTVERLQRILALVPFVIANPGVSVETLCERFGASRADILQDLDLVLMCGLPGYGPSELMDVDIWDDEVEIDAADYFSQPLRLTAVEALMMLAGAMAMQSAGADDPALGRAVTKLSNVLLPEKGLVDVDLGAEPGMVRTLRAAAEEARVVHLVYTSLGSGETTERDVEPWAVFASLGNWYLVGHCRLAGGERSFRLDRIRDLATTDQGFEPPKDRPEAAIRYSAGADDLLVHIELQPEASWVAEYYPVKVLAAEAGGVVVEFAATDPEVVARLMLRLGQAARIVGGPDADTARSATAELRGRVTSRYE